MHHILGIGTSFTCMHQITQNAKGREPDFKILKEQGNTEILSKQSILIAKRLMQQWPGNTVDQA